MFKWLKCKLGLCDWAYQGTYDNDFGNVMGKYYTCPRCGGTKWEVYDGRVYLN